MFSYSNVTYPGVFKAHPGVISANSGVVEANPEAIEALESWMLTPELVISPWSYRGSQRSRGGPSCYYGVSPLSCGRSGGAMEAHPRAVDAHLEPRRLTLEFWRFTEEPSKLTL
jgi:hypothetical protein